MAKITTLFTLILIYTQAFAATAKHHIPQTSQEHGVDIPQVGSSMFDKIYSKINTEGKAVYDVPFPIGKLMQRIPKDGVNSIVHSMLPFSRSLQRPNNLSYEPLLNPRLVFAPRFSDTAIERAKLFIGYVKKVDQLEVISYNDEAGRYEYQLVKDYSKNPKVFYVDRGKCLSCHQGQAPIFSVPGWQDTNSGIMGGLIGAKIGVENPRRINGKVKLAKKLFGHMPSDDQVGQFDALVRLSNEIALDERVWLVGCGESNACRLGLVLKTLAPNSRETSKYFEISKNIIRNSKLTQQKKFSSFLTSSDIGALKVLKKYGADGPGNSFENTVAHPEAILEIIDNIYKLDHRDNPASLREREFSDSDLFKALSGFSANDTLIISKELPNVATQLVNLYNSQPELFDKKAINKPLIMWTLLSEAGSSKADIYKKWVNKKTPVKRLFKGATMPAFQTRELNVFARHCAKCHGTGFAFPPQFLLGTEKEVIGKITKLRNKIHFKLSKDLMPPNPRDRRYMESSGDRDLLIKYVETFIK